MLDILKTVLPSSEQWEMIVEGMRNSYNSWGLSDSTNTDEGFILGDADRMLMNRLNKSGSSHAKYRRMIPVLVTINAPLYWWKEFDTYKVGTVTNSCSTMHTVHRKEFELSDFSHEHLLTNEDLEWGDFVPIANLDATIAVLNYYRRRYLRTKDKKDWWQIIQLLPSSYNQRRTVTLNYEVLSNIYEQRKDHALDEWKTFCDWILSLPCSDLITGIKKD